MLQGIKAVIFDIDGTLLDSNGVWHQVDVDFMGARGLERPDDLQDKIDGLSFRQVAVFFKKEFGVEESPEELMEIWHNMAYVAYNEHIKAKPGAARFIEHLHNKGIKMGIATSNSHELIEAGLRNNGLYDYMDCVVTADEINTSKDKPDIYLEVANRLDTTPEHCLVFEDIYPAINAANEANMTTCAVYDKKSIDIYGEDVLKEAADFFIKDYRDIIDE